MVERINISRELVQSGRLEKIAAEYEKQGLFERLPQAERDATRHAILSELDDDDDVWLFAYGSLLWNPTIEFEDVQRGQLFGFHRRFCLWTNMGRGTPEQPGLVFGLDTGGSCLGMAYRIAAHKREEELSIVWNREMISGAYLPRLLSVRTDQGMIKAIAFVMDRNSQKYAGHLAIEEVADVVACAEGPLGGCWEYLFQTVDKLAEFELRDGHLDQLADLVRAYPEYRCVER